MYGAEKLLSESGLYVLCNQCETRIPSECDECPICGSHDINRERVYHSQTDGDHTIVDQFLISYLADMNEEE